MPTVFPLSEIFRNVAGGEGDVIPMAIGDYKGSLSIEQAIKATSLFSTLHMYRIAENATFSNADNDHVFVDFGWVDNAALPNAFAIRDDDYVACGVYQAAVDSAWSLSAALFSHPAFLKEIGEPAKEHFPIVDASLYVGLPIFTMDTTYSPEQRETIARVMPQCAVRRRAAILLAGSIVDYMWKHETSHIILGHLDRRFLTGNRLRLAECDSTARSTSQLPADRHLHFEYEADRSAAVLLLGEPNVDYYADIGIFDSLDKSIIQSVKLLTPTAASILWDMYSTASALEMTTERSRSETHPNTYSRLAASITNTVAIADKLYAMRPAAVYELLGQLTVIEAYHHLLGKYTSLLRGPAAAAASAAESEALRDKFNAEMRNLVYFPRHFWDDLATSR